MNETVILIKNEEGNQYFGVVSLDSNKDQQSLAFIDNKRQSGAGIQFVDIFVAKQIFFTTIQNSRNLGWEPVYFGQRNFG